MGYVVDLRWRNPGPAKYLIDSWQFETFEAAHSHAKDIASKLDDEHFVEIREAETGEKITSFINTNAKS